MKVDDEKLLKALNNYVKSMTKKQLEAYIAEERLDYFYGGFVEQEEIDEFIKSNGSSWRCLNIYKQKHL